MTTHYMDEAENCDRIAIIDHGKIQALDAPAVLHRRIGGDTVVITGDPALERDIESRYGVAVQRVGPEFHFRADRRRARATLGGRIQRPHPVDPGQTAEPRRRLLAVDGADHP